MQCRISPHMASATFLQSYSDPTVLPEGIPQIAFLGRSNAGKSSLINAITGVKGLARTSATPGRTRLLNVFEVDRRYHLVDLPGYGFATGSKMEREELTQLIDGYLTATESLKLAVVIVDARLGPTRIDDEMIESLRMSGVPLVIIANKADKCSKSELAKMMASIRAANPDAIVIAHSVVSGIGKGELLDQIQKHL